MKVALFSKEYPPHLHGGAGVHVAQLSRALARLMPVEVRCFGDQDFTEGNLTVRGYPAWPEAERNTDRRFVGAVDAFGRSLAMAKDRLDADIVHCHTWYTAMAGLIASRLWGMPWVLTTHSLEPLRPWKVEQLGSAYRLSAWMERTAIEQADAVIAVSEAMRQDVLRLFPVRPERVRVIHNGVDAEAFRPVAARDALARHGIDPEASYLLVVGRIARQKGIGHLLDAIPQLEPALQVVLCASAPDTPEIGRETEERVAAIRSRRPGVIWIHQTLPRAELVQLYSHAAMFCCPSVYEPFGIVTLEAMACGTAVVASAVGGIREVVVPGETGLLVDPHLEPGTAEPADAAGFAASLAAAINSLARDPELCARLGRNGRRRVIDRFSWEAVAEKTIELYRFLLEPLASRRPAGAQSELTTAVSRHLGHVDDAGRDLAV